MLSREKYDDGLRHLKACGCALPDDETKALWYEILRNQNNDKFEAAFMKLITPRLYWHENENIPLMILEEIERQEKK